MEEITHLFPQGPFGSELPPNGLKQSAGELLGLIDQKGQHHQHDKNFTQVFLAQSVIVPEMVPLVFEGVECFVLNLPAGTATAHQLKNVLFGHGKIGNPAKMKGLFPFSVLPVVDHVNRQIEMGLIKR